MPDSRHDGRFTVLASEEKYTGRILSVRVDTVSMPNGTSARREIVDHMRAVAVVALDEAGSVVMIEQYRHPMRRRLWEVPAGLMDIADESPLVCAQRELAEEVGLAAESWSILVDLVTSPGYCNEAVRVYLAQDLSAVSAPEREDEEADLRVVRVPLEAAVAAVTGGQIVNATAVAGILAASRAMAGAAQAADGTRGRGGTGGLRPADDAWASGPAVVNTSDNIGSAPNFGVAPDAAPKER